MVVRFKSKNGGGDLPVTKLQVILDRQCVEAKGETKKVRMSLYASDVFQCPRKVWFQFFPGIFIQEEIGARTARIFDNGDAVHERLGGYLKRELKIDFRDELNVPRDSLDVHGRCDGICTIDEQALVVEFKSINKEYVSEPKEEHVGQVTWYMEMFRQRRLQLREEFNFRGDEVITEELLLERTKELDGGRLFEDIDHVERWLLLTQGEVKGEIVYESKATNHTYHFPVEYDERMVEKVRTFFESVKKQVDLKEMPQVRYLRDKFPCSWGYGQSAGRCGYFEYCWGKKEDELPELLEQVKRN